MPTPRQRVAAHSHRVGRELFARQCVAVLEGAEPDPALMAVLGGDSLPALQADPSREDAYWLRVWALRGLLWGWHDLAEASVIAALSDEAWRVREMAAKVVARHVLDEALEAVVRLRDDPVRRVREAAARAVESLSGAREEGA